MKKSNKLKTIVKQTGITFLLFALFSLATNMSFAQDAKEIAIELQGELKLSDDQTGKVEKLLAAYTKGIQGTMEKHDTEEPDPQAMIKDLKKVRADYLKNLKNVLSPEQMTGYNNYVQKITKEVFDDIAEIQLLEMKPTLKLTDEQVVQLKPIIGSGMLDLFKVAWKYGDKRINIRTKIKVVKALKKIQSETRTGVSKVLSPEQLKAWDEFKKAKQEKAKQK